MAFAVWLKPRLRRLILCGAAKRGLTLPPFCSLFRVASPRTLASARTLLICPSFVPAPPLRGGFRFAGIAAPRRLSLRGGQSAASQLRLRPKRPPPLRGAGSAGPPRRLSAPSLRGSRPSAPSAAAVPRGPTIASPAKIKSNSDDFPLDMVLFFPYYPLVVIFNVN